MKLTIRTSSEKAMKRFVAINNKGHITVNDILKPLLAQMDSFDADDVAFSTNMENKPNQKITLKLSKEMGDDEIQQALSSTKKSAK